MHHRCRFAAIVSGAAPVALFLFAAGIVAPRPAQADIILSARLTNDQENPPAVPVGRPASFGDAIFTLNDTNTAMAFTATIYNIDFTGTQTATTNDNLVAAHIHAGPAVTPTTNGPVVWGFFGTPFNDNNPNDVVFTPFATGVGGTISGKWDAPEGNGTTLGAQIANILAGRSYINFHTVGFPGGEVRGNITVVPEPGAVATGLVMAGALGLGLVRGRTRRGAGAKSA